MATQTTTRRRRGYSDRFTKSEIFEIRAKAYGMGFLTFPILYVAWPFIQQLIAR